MSTPEPTSPTDAARMTRAQRATLPLTADVAQVLAEAHGVCIRPVAMRRVDTTTGRVEVVPVPCGSTREDQCRPCAEKARRLRMAQCREGWHLDTEPTTSRATPSDEHQDLMGARADLLAAYTECKSHGDELTCEQIAESVAELDTELRAAGVRGRLTPLDGPPKPVKRSTRRRQDAPDLPRRPIEQRTLGQVFAGRYRPSTFLTLTLDSYGPVDAHGAAVDPETYDYQRAARDAIHFPALLDRFWQNTRRCVGWDVQYFGTVEPQKRGAPHFHAALRGTIPRTELRAITAATYHQVWWPSHDQLIYHKDHVPVWDARAKTFTDPDTGTPLPSWDRACAELTEPAHVVRFGTQVHVKGILGGTEEAGRHVGYFACLLPHTAGMAASRPRRAGGRTQIELEPDRLVWALYGRESFDPKGLAEQVTHQLAEMRPFALGLGGRIGREYPENNVSAFRRVRVALPDGTYGYRVVRPDWDAMMTALRRGEFNALCLPNIDRGMRDPRDLEDLIDLVEHYGVYVVGLTGSIDLTSDEGISGARREVDQRNRESRNISRRIANGNRRAALAGRHHGGANRPFGWRSDRVSVNKREARHIRRELPRLLAGVRPRTIAVEWNERGIPTVTGAVWRAGTIAQIFTSARLCGWQTYLGKVLTSEDGSPVRGVWEPIVTEEEHHALVAAIRPTESPVVPRRGRGSVTRRLLSPFTRCGKCNARMYGTTSEYDKRTGEPIVIYRCPGKGFGGCGGVSRKAAPIEEYVTTLVLMEQSKIALRKLEELPPWDKEQDLARVLGQIKETTQAYENQRISGGRYFPLIERLEARERKLRAEKRQYDAKRQARVEAATDLASEWNRTGFTLEQKQAAIAKSITAIVIHPAPRLGAKFSPDQLTVVWKTDDDE